MSELSDLTKDELIEKAKAAGIPYSGKNKDELVADLQPEADREKLEENLSPEGQEALEAMGEAYADAAALELDAAGPLHLEHPDDRIEVGAANEEIAEEQEELRGDEEVVGDLPESGPVEEEEEEVVPQEPYLGVPPLAEYEKILEARRFKGQQ
jgi:post-segregation antitoxin (ccd killing protein)